MMEQSRGGKDFEQLKASWDLRVQEMENLASFEFEKLKKFCFGVSDTVILYVYFVQVESYFCHDDVGIIIPLRRSEWPAEIAPGMHGSHHRFSYFPPRGLLVQISCRGCTTNIGSILFEVSRVLSIYVKVL